MSTSALKSCQSCCTDLDICPEVLSIMMPKVKLAEPVLLVHEVDLAEVFDPWEHGEEPRIGVVELSK